MERREAIRKLNLLVQMNLDAARVYEQALTEMDFPGLRERLGWIRDDHRQHALELADEIRALGGVPEYLPDAFGLAAEGLASIPKRAAAEESLKVLVADEQVTALRYRTARSWELPPAIADLIRRQHEAEEAHLQYLREEIGRRIWMG